MSKTKHNRSFLTMVLISLSFAMMVTGCLTSKSVKANDIVIVGSFVTDTSRLGSKFYCDSNGSFLIKRIDYDKPYTTAELKPDYGIIINTPKCDTLLH